MVSGNIFKSICLHWSHPVVFLSLNESPPVPSSVRPEPMRLAALWRERPVPPSGQKPDLSVSGGFHRWWTGVCGWVSQRDEVSSVHILQKSSRHHVCLRELFISPPAAGVRAAAFVLAQVLGRELRFWCKNFTQRQSCSGRKWYRA